MSAGPESTGVATRSIPCRLAPELGGPTYERSDGGGIRLHVFLLLCVGIYLFDALVRTLDHRGIAPGFDCLGFFFHRFDVDFGLLIDLTEDLLDVIQSQEFARLPFFTLPHPSVCATRMCSCMG